MRSTGRRGVRRSFSTPRTSTYTLSFEGNASLFVRTGAVICERDNQTVPAGEPMKRLGKCACDIVAKATPANFGGLRLRKSTTPVRSSSAAPNMLGDGRRPAYITGHTDGRLVCHGEDCDAEACFLFPLPTRRASSTFRLCRLVGAGDGRFADGRHVGWRGRTGANCADHHRGR